MNLRLFNCVFIALLINATLTAAAPKAVKMELAKFRPLRVMWTVDAMPAALKWSLAQLFQQKKFEMSDPHGPLGSTESIIAGDPKGFAPMRRLIFAFETKHFYFVYYEKGHPEGGASPTVFRKNNSGSAHFEWGGLDEHVKYAKNPQELASRIFRGEIRDNLPFIW